MRINRGFQQEKSRNRVIEPSENLYVCITNVIFSLSSFSRCDYYIESRVRRERTDKEAQKVYAITFDIASVRYDSV